MKKGKRAYCDKFPSGSISFSPSDCTGPAGRQEDDDKIMHVEDAKAGENCAMELGT